jgi:hypothetical protein
MEKDSAEWKWNLAVYIYKDPFPGDKAKIHFGDNAKSILRW